jgi:hypothetical protein
MFRTISLAAALCRLPFYAVGQIAASITPASIINGHNGGNA